MLFVLSQHNNHYLKKTYFQAHVFIINCECIYLLVDEIIFLYLKQISSFHFLPTVYILLYRLKTKLTTILYLIYSFKQISIININSWRWNLWIIFCFGSTCCAQISIINASQSWFQTRFRWNASKQINKGYEPWEWINRWCDPFIIAFYAQHFFCFFH